MKESTMIRLKAERMSTARLTGEIIRIELAYVGALRSPEPGLRRQAARHQRRLKVYHAELASRRATTTPIS